MGLHLSREQEMLREVYHDFAENEVESLTERVGENEAFLRETVKRMTKLGTMGIYFPREYDGADTDVLSYVMVVEEISRVRGTTGAIISVYTSLYCAPTCENGTEKQKKYYLPRLCSDEWIGAFGLTGPGAGTDAQGQQITAVLNEKGESWILNDSEISIANADYANVFVVFAITGIVTDKRGRKKREIFTFIMERTDPSFSMGKHEKEMGIKGPSICELTMEDCIIPKDRLLSKQGKGFGIAMGTLDDGRIGAASQALGLAEGAIEETVKYTKERVQLGRRISQFQNAQFQPADMHAKTEATKWLVYSATMERESHEPYTVDATMAKLVAVEAVSDVTCHCVQLFGGYGCACEYPMERMIRDAKTTEIYENTSEVQCMVISAGLGVS